MSSMQASRTARLIEELDAAFAWMTARGVDVGRDRLAAYRKIGHKWDELAAGQGKLGPQALQPIVATLAYDAAAFAAVHRAFAPLSAAQLGGLAERLGDAARGPIRIEDVRSSGPGPARDALFEALTAAMLHGAESGPACASDADRTALTHGRHHVHVECHRLENEDGIEPGLKDACRRLSHVFDARPGARKRGLVALDASRLFLSRPGMQDQPEALPAFVERHAERIQHCLSGMDRRVIGVLVYASTVVPGADGRDLVHRERWVVIRRHLVNISEAHLLERLHAFLHGEK